MCHVYRASFRCTHLREEYRPHKGGVELSKCKELKVILEPNIDHDCLRCIEQRGTGSSPSQTDVNNVKNITAALTGTHLSAPTPPAPTPRRQSAPHAEDLKRAAAARQAKQRAAQATKSAAAAGKQPTQPDAPPPPTLRAQAGAPPTLKTPAGTTKSGNGAPVGTPSARVPGGRAVGGVISPAAATATATRVPAVKRIQVPAKVQGRVVVPGGSRV